MTDIDTEELRRLTLLATPAPWKWGWTTDLTSPPTKRFTKDSYTVEPAVCATSRLKGGFDDAALIVAMRNALPDLLASLDAKDAEIERLRAALVALVEQCEAIGDDRRYWPREMRLYGTYRGGYRLFEAALDAAIDVLTPKEDQ